MGGQWSATASCKSHEGPRPALCQRARTHTMCCACTEPRAVPTGKLLLSLTLKVSPVLCRPAFPPPQSPPPPPPPPPFAPSASPFSQIMRVMPKVLPAAASPWLLSVLSHYTTTARRAVQHHYVRCLLVLQTMQVSTDRAGSLAACP